MLRRGVRLATFLTRFCPPHAPPVRCLSHAPPAAHPLYTVSNEALLAAIADDSTLLDALPPETHFRCVTLTGPFADVDDEMGAQMRSLYRATEAVLAKCDSSHGESVRAAIGLAVWLGEDKSPARKKLAYHVLVTAVAPFFARAINEGALAPPQVAAVAWAFGRGQAAPHVPVWPAVLRFAQRAADASAAGRSRCSGCESARNPTQHALARATQGAARNAPCLRL